jgi:hypothetical protein
VQTYLQTGTCRQRRQAENLAMQAVTVEQVCEACHTVLQQASAKQAA